jgi:hypothetical protein
LSDFTVTDEMIETFGLGRTPEEYQKLMRDFLSMKEIHNIPVLKDDKVIGVCIEHKNGAYRCEIWDRSVEKEIACDIKQITAIVLK